MANRWDINYAYALTDTLGVDLPGHGRTIPRGLPFRHSPIHPLPTLPAKRPREGEGDVLSLWDPTYDYTSEYVTKEELQAAESDNVGVEEIQQMIDVEAQARIDADELLGSQKADIAHIPLQNGVHKGRYKLADGESVHALALTGGSGFWEGNSSLLPSTEAVGLPPSGGIAGTILHASSTWTHVTCVHYETNTFYRKVCQNTVWSNWTVYGEATDISGKAEIAQIPIQNGVNKGKYFLAANESIHNLGWSGGSGFIYFNSDDLPANEANGLASGKYCGELKSYDASDVAFTVVNVATGKMYKKTCADGVYTLWAEYAPDLTPELEQKVNVVDNTLFKSGTGSIPGTYVLSSGESLYALALSGSGFVSFLSTDLLPEELSGLPVSDGKFSGYISVHNTTNAVIHVTQVIAQQFYVKRCNDGVWGEWLLLPDNGQIENRITQLETTVTQKADIAHIPVQNGVNKGKYIVAPGESLHALAQTGCGFFAVEDLATLPPNEIVGLPTSGGIAGHIATLSGHYGGLYCLHIGSGTHYWKRISNGGIFSDWGGVSSTSDLTTKLEQLTITLETLQKRVAELENC